MGRAMPVPAEPSYFIGDEVKYKDRQGRLIIGTIRYINASWDNYSGGERKDEELKPHISYCINHPTARDKRMVRSEEDIIGLS